MATLRCPPPPERCFILGRESLLPRLELTRSRTGYLERQQAFFSWSIS